MTVHHTTWSLFEEPYWLDCVAPNVWHVAEFKKGQQVIGRLPYVVNKRWGMNYITKPPFTPWLGPWYLSTGAKYTNELGNQKEIITGLIDSLPPVKNILIPSAPEVTNLLPFYWKGFKIQVSYTYRIQQLSDLEAVWKEFRENIRRECRKAERKLIIRDDLGIEDFLKIQEKTFERQGINHQRLDPILRRIDNVMSERNQRRILCAQDSKNRIHAAIYIVWDERHTFYLAGGGDPTLRSSGAHSLLMWHAIQHAAKVSQVFDFEGSMLESIERYFRAFGAKQTIRFSAVRESVFFSNIKQYFKSKYKMRALLRI